MTGLLPLVTEGAIKSGSAVQVDELRIHSVSRSALSASPDRARCLVEDAPVAQWPCMRGFWVLFGAGGAGMVAQGGVSGCCSALLPLVPALPLPG